MLNTKQRFSFGKNWANFLKCLNEDRIKEAEKSLIKNLELDNLKGKTFLDIGSGSGLFSLAAHRLGAEVFSFDYDDDAVNCTKYLKDQYAKNSNTWQITQGSILDKKFLNQILKQTGKFDIVYSWGVLHHTGNMSQAFKNAVDFVNPEGLLFISIYNDQGIKSKIWKWIKKKYNYSSTPIKYLLCLNVFTIFWIPKFVIDFIIKGNPLHSWHTYGKNNRSMSAWHDVVDWTGGYPFEVAKPEEVFNFFKIKQFKLKKLKTCGGKLGCNEFVFQKI